MITVLMHQLHFYCSYDFHQVNDRLQKYTIKSEEHIEEQSCVSPPKKFIQYSFCFDRAISCVIYWLNTQD